MYLEGYIGIGATHNNIMSMYFGKSKTISEVAEEPSTMDFESTIHPVSWFRDRYRDGTLEIKPPYQRMPVWTIKQKCYLIETILLDLPIPEIYVQKTTSTEGDTTYAIVDGQQRIRSVLQFIGSESDPREEEYNKFVLDKLGSDSRWRNLSFSELNDDEKKAFYGYSFAVRYLNTEQDTEVRDIFRRLNKYLTPLKPQELRNATYSGPFIRLAERLADNEYWSENRIVRPASIRRQADIEFTSELLIGVLHGPQGGSAKIIDDYYFQYEDYDDEFPEQKAATRLFALTMQTIQQILPNIKGARWSNKTDFYTLFVAVASLLRSNKLTATKISQLRRVLYAFADDIDSRLANENAQVSRNAIDYVRAVEKGANDKKRRADRHLVLSQVIDEFFKPKRKTK